MPHHQPHINPILKWSSLVVLSLALAIIIIDSTLLNVAISTLIKDLHTDIQSIQWVISAYSLVLAALTITGGRLGDIFGRKKMFMLGAVLFAIGSVTASLANNFSTLLWGESIIEGIGAALMMPATASLLVSNFEGRDRAIAFGVWGGIAGAAAAIGPIVGGFVTSNYSWRWGFRINVVVVILLLLGSYLVKDGRGQNKNLKLDYVGVVLSALGLFGIVFGLIESATYGWWKAKQIFTVYGHSLPFGELSVVPVFLLLGVIFLVLFLLWQYHRESTHQTALVSPSIFKNRQFSSGVLVVSIISMSLSGLIFAVPIFLQAVRGLDAFHTGLALLPLSLTMLVVAPLSAVVSTKVSPKYVIQFGMFMVVLSSIVQYFLLKVDSTPASFIPGLVLAGIGLGSVMSQINNFILSALPPEMAGEASGVNNTMRQLGSSLGSAIVGAALLSTISGGVQTRIDSSTVIPTRLKPVIAQAAAAHASEGAFSANEGSSAATVSPAISSELTRIRQEATTEGNRNTLVYTGMFGLLGFLLSFLLPKKLTESKREAPAAGH
jgi:EmrB/QacA subfamily drug resistance transporter